MSPGPVVIEPEAGTSAGLRSPSCGVTWPASNTAEVNAVQGACADHPPAVASPPLTLSALPETMLWPLWNRACEATRTSPLIVDPMSIDLVRRIDYDFRRAFGPPDIGHAIRARFCDDLVRAFLKRNGNATVVALGEGLDTQLWRVDDGRVRWISVDLDEGMDVRRRFLPRHERNTLITGSALDTSWLDAVAAERPLFIAAAGLLMYFERAEVLRLLRAITSRVRDAELFFDTIAPWFSQLTLRGFKLTRHYTVPPMPFGLRLGDVGRFVAEVPRLRVVSTHSYAEPFPWRSGPYAPALFSPWVRDILAPGLVHARVGDAQHASCSAALAGRDRSEGQHSTCTGGALRH